MTTPAALECESLAYVAGGARALDSVSLTLGAGERLAVVGANGAGKSVLARLAVGLAPPMSGTVRLFGEDLRTASLPTLRRLRGRLGLVLQGGSLLSGLSVEDNLRLALPGGGRERDARLDRALINFDLAHAPARLADNLSASEGRRVELARAFLREPELLILDDPFEGADQEAAEDMMVRVEKALRRRAPALLLLTHSEGVAARFAERILRLERGRLTAV